MIFPGCKLCCRTGPATGRDSRSHSSGVIETPTVIANSAWCRSIARATRRKKDNGMSHGHGKRYIAGI